MAAESQQRYGSHNLMGIDMTPNRAGQCFAYAVVASLALGTAAVHATGDPASSAAAVQVAAGTPVTLALAGDAPAVLAGAPEAAPARASFNPRERGVRAAAAQGPTALRRYVQRTEAIYQFSYWDFAKYLPANE